MTFDLFPAIDLRSGRVVRLLHGDDAARTRYDDEPAAVLARYLDAGARWVHLVDLDAAFGETPQGDLLAHLAHRCAGRARVEIGGGLRDDDSVAAALAVAERAVVGSMVAREPARFAALAARFPGRLVAAVEARNGEARIAGWREGAGAVADLARSLDGLPCAAVLVTDVGRDGAMSGPNLELAARVATWSGLPALVSGGVRSVEDLADAAATPGIAGAVLGKALLDGHVDLADAFAVLAALERAEEAG